jgi:hypothetical protein
MSDEHIKNHPAAQLQAIIKSNGKLTYQHGDGSQTKMTRQIAQRLLQHYDEKKTSEERQEFSDTIHKNHGSMKSTFKS